MNSKLKAITLTAALAGIFIASCSKDREKDWICECTTNVNGLTSVNKERLLMLRKDVAESRCKADNRPNTECILKDAD